MTTKLWQKNFSVNEAIEKFTIGNDFQLDLNLAKHDVFASKAHAKMLHKINLITREELNSILTGLEKIDELIKEGKFVIQPGVEDVHSQIELLLTAFAGDAGKKIHTARSRNDQVLTAIKLFLREELCSIKHKTVKLINVFNVLAEKYKDIPLPGYTHFQVAMPSSFDLWFGAYADSLEEDLLVLETAYTICDKNPLGSAAGYGTNFPVDKTATASEMKFSGVNENPVYAQMTRGKTEKQASWAIASIAATISKFSYDACLYMSQNFNFIALPDEFTTGSSIMPHKKNPDVFELLRAKCNVLQGLPNQLTLLCSNLPHGYHRDMQLTKQILFPGITELQDCLEMMSLICSEIQVNRNIMDDEKYKYIHSVEEVNKLVMEGIPFREAYRIVADKIGSSSNS